MTQLSWDNIGERLFETGVDRGVLFVGGNPGVAWNGLTSIQEAPTGGSATPFYLDGVKYLNVVGNEDFAATLNAFTSPPEFDPCDGTATLYAGLYTSQQPRVPFNLAYRTLKGNDVVGTDYGYKLHLVYNATAAPASIDNSTISDSTTPAALSWAITTVPVAFPGIKPSAHFIIDSIASGPDLMTALETLLYGTAFDDPAFPTPAELIGFFQDFGALIYTQDGMGHWTATGEPVNIENPDLNFTIDDPSVVDNGDGTFTITY